MAGREGCVMPRGWKEPTPLGARAHPRRIQHTSEAYTDVADALGLDIAWGMRQVLAAGTLIMQALVGALTEDNGAGGLMGLAPYQRLLAGLHDAGAHAMSVRPDKRLAHVEQAKAQDSHTPSPASVRTGLFPSEAASRGGDTPVEGPSVA